ncbi:MAG: 5-oxoprolinase subunit PxpA [Trueperaceae bacterium]|nr:5-oxoprolinase subunit PxpA [Trueperaceae bacterium]
MPDANGGEDDVDEGVRVDLNADAGESFGAWPMGADTRLFPALSSVNVACGFHAGDPATMLRTVRLAREHGVAIGAHPGYPDLVGFGRRDMAVDPEQVHADVLYQLGALSGILRAEGLALHHVKPHGALHHRVTQDEAAADAVARAIRDVSADVPFVVLGGPGGTVMQQAAQAHGLRTIREAFPDRAYLASGTLAPRTMPGALVHDPDEVAARAVAMVTRGEVPAVDGGSTRVEAETLCIHGDGPRAPDIAAAVREALEGAGVEVRAHGGVDV